MVYRASISKAAFLAFLAACFACSQPSAVAGDKIEFTSPPDILAVPRPERSVKEDTAAAIRETLSHHHTEGADFTTGGSVVTIVIPASKSHDHFGWTPPFEENQDKDSDMGSDLFTPRKPAATHTNSWNTPKETDSAISRDRDRDKDKGWSREGSWMQPDEGLTRFSADSMQRSGEHGGDWLSRRLDQHTAPEWTRSMASDEPKEYERMRKEGFAPPQKEDFSTFYNPLSGNSPQNEFGSAAESSRVRGSSGILGKAWADDSLRGQGEQQGILPSAAPAMEELPNPAHPNRSSSSRDQTFSAQTHAPYAPAVLAFPKRPGDLFQ